MLTLPPDVAAQHHRAADVPRLRDELARSWRSGILEEVLYDHAASQRGRMYVPANPDGSPWSIPQWCDWLRERLDVAELFYVTADMTELVRQAAAARPRYELWEDRLPARCGFVVYGRTFCEVPAENLPAGQRCELQAGLWSVVPDTGAGGPGIMLVTMQDADVLVATQPLPRGDRDLEQVLAMMRSRMGPIAYHEEYPLPFGDRPYDLETGPAIKNTAVGALMTTWALMGQRISTVEREQLPRGVRRQYSREGRPEPMVRTVDLRRTARGRDAERQEREPGREGARRYRHRWPVRGYGYWRDTWYPSRQRHEQQWVWVPGYMKGPEGAPLIGGERVNVLRR